MAKTNPLTNQLFHTLKYMRAIRGSTTNLFKWVARSGFLAEQYGYVIQFDPNQGAKSGKQIVSKTRWGLTVMVVFA